MAIISSEIASEVGAWLTISEWDGAELRALVHRDAHSPETGVSIYWPAREDAPAFARFFEDAVPRVEDFRPGRTRFQRRVAFLSDTGEAEILDSDAETVNFDRFAFLRLEEIETASGAAEHPTLVVWSNLNAGRADDIPIDAAGVLFQPRHLASLEQPLAVLISQSSAEQPRLSSVVATLEALGNHLRGGAGPMAASA